MWIEIMSLDMIYSYCNWFFFFKQKTAYEMRISDWSSDVCSSDLRAGNRTTSGFLDRRVAAGVIGMPVGVPDVGDRPAARRGRFQHGIGDSGVADHRRLAVGIVAQPDIIVAEDGNTDGVQRSQLIPFQLSRPLKPERTPEGLAP